MITEVGGDTPIGRGSRVLPTSPVQSKPSLLSWRAILLVLVQVSYKIANGLAHFQISFIENISIGVDG